MSFYEEPWNRHQQDREQERYREKCDLILQNLPPKGEIAHIDYKRWYNMLLKLNKAGRI